MTDILARKLISDLYGEEMRSTSGIPGEFYTTDRKADVKTACREIIDSRRN